jgi:hypothetical protein
VSEGAAGENTREHVHRHRDGAALVLRLGQDDAVDRLLRIDGRRAPSVDRPAFRDLVTLLARKIDFAAGYARVGDVEH